MFTQIVYTSHRLFPVEVHANDSVVDGIVADARRNNPKFGITGYLLVGPDWFAQILEGPAIGVSTIFKKILADLRHQGPRIVDSRLVRDRNFENWDMGVTVLTQTRFLRADATGNSSAFARDLMTSEQIFELARRNAYPEYMHA